MSEQSSPHEMARLNRRLIIPFAGWRFLNYAVQSSSTLSFILNDLFSSELCLLTL